LPRASWETGREPHLEPSRREGEDIAGQALLGRVSPAVLGPNSDHRQGEFKQHQINPFTTVWPCLCSPGLMLSFTHSFCNYRCLQNAQGAAEGTETKWVCSLLSRTAVATGGTRNGPLSLSRTITLTRSLGGCGIPEKGHPIQLGSKHPGSQMVPSQLKPFHFHSSPHPPCPHCCALCRVDTG
jgi:hypothetical protein